MNFSESNLSAADRARDVSLELSPGDWVMGPGADARCRYLLSEKARQRERLRMRMM